MKEHWFRCYHGAPADPKWKVVAARASHTMSRHVTPANVLAVWLCMMDCASQADPRGELLGWDDEDVGALLDIPADEVTAIRAAMQGKTLDGNRLKAWEKRQPKRERDDPSASSRKAAQRLRDSGENTEVAPSHATSRQVTPRGEERREEEKREEKANLSVGKPEPSDSRASPAETPTARAEPGERTGQIAKLLRANGVRYVNPSHVLVLELAASGATDSEIVDMAKEAVERGKPNLSWTCSTLLGRKRDAANATPTSVGDPRRSALVTGSGAHRPYVPEKRQRRDPSLGAPVQFKDLAASLGVGKKPEPEGDPPPAPNS